MLLYMYCLYLFIISVCNAKPLSLHNKIRSKCKTLVSLLVNSNNKDVKFTKIILQNKTLMLVNVKFKKKRNEENEDEFTRFEQVF